MSEPCCYTLDLWLVLIWQIQIHVYTPVHTSIHTHTHTLWIREPFYPHSTHLCGWYCSGASGSRFTLLLSTPNTQTASRLLGVSELQLAQVLTTRQLHTPDGR